MNDYAQGNVWTGRKVPLVTELDRLIAFCEKRVTQARTNPDMLVATGGRRVWWWYTMAKKYRKLREWVTL